MSVANYFGATEADVLQKYAVGGYSPVAADFGGSPSIANALSSAESEVIQAMGADLWRNVTDPELELIETRATAGQVIVQLGIAPVFPRLVWIWRNQPAAFQRDRPMKQTDRLIDMPPGYGPFSPAIPLYGPSYDINFDQFVTDAATGAVTLLVPLQNQDQVYASYRVNTEDSTFNMPSIADLVATYAAYLLGEKVYPREDTTWQYVETLKEDAENLLDQLNKGTWTPSEIRLLRWWKPVEKAQENTIGSIRRWRS